MNDITQVQLWTRWYLVHNWIRPGKLSWSSIDQILNTRTRRNIQIRYGQITNLSNISPASIEPSIQIRLSINPPLVDGQTLNRCPSTPESLEPGICAQLTSSSATILPGRGLIRPPWTLSFVPFRSQREGGGAPLLGVGDAKADYSSARGSSSVFARGARLGSRRG